MDWTSWSQTWLIKSTTTTSRRPLKRRRKYLRWRRKYLLLQADERLKQNQEDLPLLAHLHELYLFVEEYGLILNQELNPIKRTHWHKNWTLFFGMDNYLEKKMGRLNPGDWKISFGTILRTLSIGLMKCGRAKWQEAEATRKKFNIVLTRQEKKFFISEIFKSFRCNPIDPTLQDNAQSITNSGLIAGRQNSSRERQTVFFTAVNPMNKEHRDPKELDLTKPRIASYKQNWKRHQDTVHWVDIQLAQRKGLKQDVTQSSFTIHS